MRSLALLGLVTWGSTANAEGPASVPSPDDRAFSRHTVYAEALGKAGPYGVGYELALVPRYALGLVASYADINGQHVTTGVAYGHALLLAGRRHALYGDLGLAVVRSHLASPVPEWDGLTDHGVGGEAALGWEWCPWRIIVRVSLGVAVGKGGVAPFLGFALGVRL